MMKDWIIDLKKARKISDMVDSSCSYIDNWIEDERKAWRKLKQIPRRLLNDKDKKRLKCLMGV